MVYRSYEVLLRRKVQRSQALFIHIYKASPVFQEGYDMFCDAMLSDKMIHMLLQNVKKYFVSQRILEIYHIQLKRHLEYRTSHHVLAVHTWLTHDKGSPQSLSFLQCAPSQCPCQPQDPEPAPPCVAADEVAGETTVVSVVAPAFVPLPLEPPLASTGCVRL